jgi:hypothetical protein
MSKSLPPHPSLDHLKNQAKQLQKSHKAGDLEACGRIQRFLPRLGKQSVEDIRKTRVSLQEAQHVVACEYGFRNWTGLVASFATSEDKAMPRPKGPQFYCLRITAKEPGSEVDFVGTILLQHPERSSYALTRRTPFELQMETTVLGGTVCATSETGKLQFELLRMEHGELRKLLGGGGRGFIFGEQVDTAFPVPRFIWAF